MGSSIAYLMKEHADPELRKLLSSLVEELTGENDTSKQIEMLLDSAIAFFDSDRAYVIEG